MSSLNLFLLRYFDIGRIKYAPGTACSFFVTIFYFFVPNNLFLQSFLIIFHLFLGFYCCYNFYKHSEEKDPSYIVIDEAVGMMIALFLIPKVLELYLLAFLIFRFLDIIKPSIINRSQYFDYGIGIMLDDILSGLITLLILSGIYL